MEQVMSEPIEQHREHVNDVMRLHERNADKLAALEQRSQLQINGDLLSKRVDSLETLVRDSRSILTAHLKAGGDFCELKQRQAELVQSSVAMVSIHQTVKDRLGSMGATFGDGLQAHATQLEGLCERVGTVEQQLGDLAFANQDGDDIMDPQARLTEGLAAMNRAASQG